ncbi:hypothetical protein BDN72DRAFT_824875 [Pluteus cervinus]|uniref:Uncharacterized protein n=1 Tax=Pluteus cervinus TaxID=181527 RepID=A0ACD3AJS9_9AGAR|nr:hypothetical protein BDN72DRAFT_824875 [Pluteus cervinus]
MSSIKVEPESSQLARPGGPVKSEPQEDAIAVPAATQNTPAATKVKKEEPMEDVIELTDDSNESEEDRKEGQSDEEDMSDGEDLRADIEEALGQLDFQGTYALSHTFSESPNPWLHVEGIGLVGLPLSERDANAVIAAASQAPFGHGSQTVVDKTVRHTWEIEPQRLSFKNPKWGSFINETVLKLVCDGLGVAFSATSVSCELYKLLLYETGSHFLPHQDTTKSPGMFATVVVVLPSQFAGGAVSVSHSDKTKVFDIAPNSMLTSILSWYTDVVHGVAPVTSGYRLALSYNLIHTSPNALPTLPSREDVLVKIRHVLRKWKHGSYQEDSQCDVLASLLAHQYSAAGLANGFAALKGEDAHMVTNLRPIAAEEGFCVYLGSLQCQISGSADEDYGYCHNPWKRRRRYYDYYDDSGCDDSDSDCPPMGEEDSRTLTISNLVDLIGRLALGSASQSLHIEESCLVQQNPFEGADPDDQEYGGYMGNYAGSVDHYYRRTVLVLLHGDDKRQLMFAAGGVGYAVAELKKANPSNITQEDRNMALMAISKLTYYPYPYGLHNGNTHATDMLDIAVLWNDLPMWKQIGEKVNYAKPVVGEAKYVDALKKFDFKAFKPVLQQALEKLAGLKEKLDFLATISAGPGQGNPTILAWCSEQKFKVLGSTCPLGNNDLPLILQIAEQDGVTKTMNCVLPILKQQKFNATFWITLIKALVQKKETAQPSSPEWKAYSQKCLDIATSSWVAENALANVQPPAPTYNGRFGYYTAAQVIQDTKASTAIQLIELCLSLDRATSCLTILDSLSKVGGDSKTKFQVLFKPCIQDLRRILPKYSLSINISPYREFAQHVIGLYLRDILGTKGQFLPSNIRKLGCGCHDCRALDAFLLSSESQYRFSRAQNMRTHLESRLRQAPDLVTFSTIRSGSPHTLLIQKKPEVIAACTWAGRQSAAREFLGNFGDEKAIRQLMGNYYANAAKAVSGEQPFAWSSNYLVQVRAAATPQAANSASSSTVGPAAAQVAIAGQAGSSTQALAGTKRKVSS